MRHLRCTKPDIDFFKDAEFSSFRSSLDAEMKRLQSKGLGSSHKQAEPLTVQEEQLWENNILGDHSPESLLNTIIFMNGLYFALPWITKYPWPYGVVMNTDNYTPQALPDSGC